MARAPLLMQRRRLWGLAAGLALSVAWARRAKASAGSDADAAAAALAQGGCALLLRHAATEPGVGDPPGFVLERCDTQRNLSAEGRRHALALGAWLRQRGLVPSAVRSSAWCRCRDTARLAFGQYAPWPALNST